MRKFQLFFFHLFLISFLSIGTSVKAETIRNTGQNEPSSPSSGDALAPFLGHPGHSVSAAKDPSVSSPLDSTIPAWASHPEVSAESKLGWALWEMTQKPGDMARAVKDTVKTSITDYVKDKQKQSRQQDLVEKFNTNLQYVSTNLHLSQRDQRELGSRVQRVYIEDAESGRYQLDSLHFGELPYIVRREYADMVLSRTKDGEAETYHLNGTLKTRWTLKGGQPDGPIVTYYENGEINFIDVFKDGQKIRRTKYDTEGKLVFEQNYEYSLPDEKKLNVKKKAAPRKKKAVIKMQETIAVLDPPSPTKAIEKEEDTPSMPETAPSQDTSGIVELPPQVSANHIEV
jgi:antitoxin component YwqK of YwqJK toxin-antitoxin module